MNRVSRDLLNVLIAVAESRNFREAAEKLQLSQPGVSLMLRRLQDDHPLALFQIEGKRKVLTHYGRALYEVAKRGASELEKSIEGLHRIYASESQLTLRVGARPEVFNCMAPYLEFDGRIEFRSLSGPHATQCLLNHEIDVAFSYDLPDSTEIIAKKVFQSSVNFIVHEKWLKKRRLTERLAKDQKFLKETPCIIYSTSGPAISEWAHHAGLSLDKLNVSFVVEDWRTVQSLVLQGFGYAVLPEYVGSVSEPIAQLALPKNIFPPYTYYALFEKSLKKITAFQRVLAFSKLP